jgi:helix-turn-helix protein
MPLQVIGGHTVYALDCQVAGIAKLCAWVEAHRDPKLDFWDQFDDCMRQSYWDKRRYRQRKSALPVPGGLLTSAEAAAKLGCSIKTLNGHIAAGALKYVAIGHGMKRPRKMFTAADLDEFIANQTRKDAPCPSDVIRAHPTGNTISRSEVVAFSARRSVRPGGKPRR